MENIKDNNRYLTAMTKTFLDKAWFMSILPDEVTTVIDFGCADNSFNNFLKENYPHLEVVGIDNNPVFVKQVRDRGELIFTSIEDLRKNYNYNPDTTVLVLNSVVHEVYSYANPEAFWADVKLLNPKYIAFRDMYAKGCGIWNSKMKIQLLDEIKANLEFNRAYEDFKSFWGDLDDGYTTLHFLYKYFYTANWGREVQENYIPYHYRELHTTIRRIGYDITVERFYGLQFLKDKWRNDFNAVDHPALNTFINAVTTHMKLFMVRGEDA